VYKLSKIQKRILRCLYEVEGECLGPQELILRVYDIDAPSEFRSQRHHTFPNSKFRKRNDEDWKAYNSLHASLSRSINRLRERGLVEKKLVGGIQPYNFPPRLTDRGKQLAEKLPPYP
jgi:hypothetical protein